jgi:hypothetical protein
MNGPSGNPTLFSITRTSHTRRVRCGGIGIGRCRSGTADRNEERQS